MIRDRNVLFVPALTLILFKILFANAEAFSLWQKAIDIYSHNEHLIPGKMRMRFEFVNNKGEPENIKITNYKIYPGENGTIISELENAYLDGKDITEKEQNKENNDKNNKSIEGFDMSMNDAPFHPQNQDSIIIIPQENHKLIQGIECQLFNYTMSKKEKTRKGEIWLDVSSGAPLFHQSTTEPLPAKVKSLTNKVYYKYDSTGRFYVEKVEFIGIGGIWFIKKKFRGSITFSDYWTKES